LSETLGLEDWEPGVGEGSREGLGLGDGIDVVRRGHSPGSGCSHEWGKVQGELPVSQGFSMILQGDWVCEQNWVIDLVPSLLQSQPNLPKSSSLPLHHPHPQLQSYWGSRDWLVSNRSFQNRVWCRRRLKGAH
jgi:hypothetical protein